ncbi:5-(carboxyamino)imidazole ribonucleotide mutase [Candidatus Williamhamiltonella defendens]|uniref:5-(carboxyamino)imidazole ribonucleotide mutase n=1 Tax=Candidatus Williamhamiltonella defendens TaxID=138072 RepID=UPI00130E5E03|nr:5-(carboxyamino)imidazole ribonucleotide mutase [Candidatus Hamiltonella defensa]
MTIHVLSSEKIRAKIAIIMGSQSDWDTMKPAVDILSELKISYDAEIISAHRTPDNLFKFAEQAETRGFSVIIAGAGGAAHLPGMIAAKTLLPVLGVPIASTSLNGIDSLYSIVQMPRGIPVGTLAIGKAGAANAALLSAQILGLQDPTLSYRLTEWRKQQTQKVLNHQDPREKK